MESIGERNKQERLREHVKRNYDVYAEIDMINMIIYCGSILALTASFIISSGLEKRGCEKIKEIDKHTSQLEVKTNEFYRGND